MKNLLLILITLLSIGLSSCSNEKMKDVTLKMTDTNIVLVNNGYETFKNINVTINDKFKTKFEVLLIKGTHGLDLSTFSDRDGNRFNSSSMKINKVYITSENSKGNEASAIFDLR